MEKRSPGFGNKLAQRPTVPIPINRSEAEIGAVQTTISGKKSKVWTVNGQRFVALCALCVALAVLSLAFTFSLPGEKKDTDKDQNVRKAAVAGGFYPGNKTDLEKYVDNLLRQADPPEIKEPIRAILVPHAGYVFSGPVAAYAYKTIEHRDIRTVILLGDCHTEWFDGISVYEDGTFETPLGSVPVDSTLTQKLLAANPKIISRPSAHAHDHILEVQLPFLQRTLKNFKIVPLVFGNSAPELSGILAQALREHLDDQTLMVISTDMSHYPAYEEAVAADRATLDAIETGRTDILDATLKELDAKKIRGAQTFLCGANAVRTVLLLAQALDPTTPVTLKYANSGDSPAGDKNRVVGYGAVAFVAKPSTMPAVPPPAAESKGDSSSRDFKGTVPLSAQDEKGMTPQEKEELLKIARSSVESYVRTGKASELSSTSPALNEPLGAFVTLKENGQLRGCIGRFEPSEPLYKTVRQISVSAASQDPRFRPVRPGELEKLEYEISVLSPLRKVANAEEIVPGKHGVSVSKGFHHGVFLPQVARETGWSKEEFLSELCSQKAGLPRDCWKDPGVTLQVFTADVFSEEKK